MANNLGIATWLAPYANQYSTPIIGQSYRDVYRNAGAQRTALRNFAENEWVNDDDVLADGSIDRVDSMLKGQQSSAAIGGALTAISGLGTVLSGAQQASQIRDTSAIENQYKDLAEFGNYNYYDYNQLANDYANMQYMPDVNEDDIRGMSLGQKIGSVGTSALSGAMTGLQVGGPWGALAGLIIGGGIGAGGVLSGDYKANMQSRYLNGLAYDSAEISDTNKGAAHERIGANTHRQNAINAVAKGGPIRRQTINEFAERVTSRNRYPSARKDVIRSYGEGGLKVRIKVK